MKRRADTRAGTEPRRAETEKELTSPYPRNFEPREEGRESVPYLEVEVTTERQPKQPRTIESRSTARVQRVVKTVSRKIGIGTGTEKALTDKPITEDVPTIAVPKVDVPQVSTSSDTTPRLDAPVQRARRVSDLPPPPDPEELEKSTERVVKVINSLTEPNGPKVRASRLKWLGVVLSPPEVGAALVIGTWLRADFCVTSPVTKVFPRDGGMLVYTHNEGRYFVEASGDTYLVKPGS